MSAAIILKLDSTREIINEALSKLRLRHREQVNLLSILCGTRYKYYHKGTLLPTWCPNKHNGQICGRTDTFEHMLLCYNLRQQMATGPDAISFLVKMAKRTLPRGKDVNHPRPRYVEV